MSSMITVVIPYFQRQPGVLRKALASIAAQSDCPLPVQVIVVDDASPVPASAELEGAAWPAPLDVRTIVQPNGGPGAARNTGLAAADAGTRYIAFLDSDDEWSPDHLARAVAALDQGFDFYFANHFQLGQSIGAFERGRRIDPNRHPVLPTVAPGLHRFDGDLFNQIMTGNPVGTSTVVFRREPFTTERFRVEFTSAGEDYLFWMTLAKRGARVAFSMQVEATYGRGVNVYSGSGWGTEGHLKRVHQEILYKLAVRELFDLTTEQEAGVAAHLKELRVAFTRDVLHRLTHRKGFPPGLVGTHLRRDPAMLLALPMNVLKITARR
jgi:succinoglycan biosynthesis protein ExoW